MKNEKESLVTLLYALVFPTPDLSKTPISEVRKKVKEAIDKRQIKSSLT